MSNTDPEKLRKELEYHVEGDLRFDEMSRHLYAVDASIYEVEPLGCIVPKRRQDIINTILIAKKHGLTITARGAGTGIAGGSIGPGLIFDMSKYLNRIREVNYEEEWVICEPGVVQDQLNDALYEQGYRLGPDTSTGNRATVGGMVGNNAAGARSLHYGKTVDAVLAVELILSDGEVLWFESCNKETLQKKCTQDDAEGRIYRRVLKIKEEYAEEIEARFPNIHRRASGYNLDHLIGDEPLNIAKLICGSEGSLGVMSRVKLAITKRANFSALVLFSFDDLLEGLEQIGTLLAFEPMAIELIDAQVIKLGKMSPSMRGKLDWLEGEPDGLLVVEVVAKDEEELDKKTAALQESGVGNGRVCMRDAESIANVWALRKAGLGLLMGRRSHAKAVAFVEDFALPPEKLASFIRILKEKVESAQKTMGMYGHAGPGCMHFRPFVDMRKEEELQWMEQLMIEMNDVVLDHGGVLSGEHGDGYLRSWLGERLFGKKIMAAFEEIKSAFDPEGMMNPGKVVPTQGFRENLRMHPGIKTRELESVMSFKHEGGFAFAAEMCNGNAACRKREGLMCPSFHASGDERHTTRARSQVLRAAINGKMEWDALTSAEAYDVMDLCIECKGCKTECPSQVDMAKMKAEFLHHYQKKHGISLRTRLFAHISTVNRFSSPVATLANSLGKTAIAKWALNKLGVTTKRELPSFAKQRFSRWFLKNYHPEDEREKHVVLFNDTFNEYNSPNVGISALKLLDYLGYEVLVPPYACCGRSLISKGLLPQAQKQAKKLIETLYPLAREGLRIVGLEPSCILTIRDELPDLVSEAKMRLIVDACCTLDEFLAEEDLLKKLPPFTKKVHLHGHCHQKALVGMQPTLKVLQKVPGADVHLIDSGCCGMAGSFGYESEHYDFSMKIGEDRLFPAIREAACDATICASGFSCRNQIQHGCGRKAKHLAEVLAEQL